MHAILPSDCLLCNRSVMQPYCLVVQVRRISTFQLEKYDNSINCLRRVGFPFVADFMGLKVLYKFDIIIGIGSHNTSPRVAWQLSVLLPPVRGLFRLYTEQLANRQKYQHFKTTRKNNHKLQCVDVCCSSLLVLAKCDRKSWGLWHPRTTWDDNQFGGGHNLLQGPGSFRKKFKAKVDEAAINQPK